MTHRTLQLARLPAPPAFPGLDAANTDSFQPAESVQLLATVASSKARQSIASLLIKGSIAGVMLGLATAFSCLPHQHLPAELANLLAGALFPVGFAVIVLLKLELIGGSFALLSIGALAGKLTLRQLLRNWSWVFVANFLGSLLIGLLLALVLTQAFMSSGGFLPARLVELAQAKTLAYQQAGLHGWVTAFIKGLLCNWLVAVAAILSIIIPTVPGKLMALWLPLWMFMALEFEHLVVNLFIIPTGMLLGAQVSLGQWLIWNLIPVTLSNLLGGVLMGVAIYYGCRHESAPQTSLAAD